MDRPVYVDRAAGRTEGAMKNLLHKRMTPQDQRLIALAMSAFVLPGAGQCMAGRWLIGVAFAISCLASFGGFIMLSAWPILNNLAGRVLEYLGDEPPPTVVVQWRWILISFVASLGLYLLNILDAWLQVRRVMKS